MSDSPAADKPGLRERKKAKTKAAIQEAALRLFRDHGYENTTVEQIADAAEVSPSTFFRYFGSKEDVVIYDALDPVFIEAFRAQPRDLKPLAALRRALHDVFSELDDDQLAEMSERGRLVYLVPELRQRMTDDMLRTASLFAGEIALRVGRSPEDLEIRVFTGALMGALIAVQVPALLEPNPDYLGGLEPVFDYLERGMPL